MVPGLLAPINAKPQIPRQGVGKVPGTHGNPTRVRCSYAILSESRGGWVMGTEGCMVPGRGASIGRGILMRPASWGSVDTTKTTRAADRTTALRWVMVWNWLLRERPHGAPWMPRHGFERGLAGESSSGGVRRLRGARRRGGKTRPRIEPGCGCLRGSTKGPAFPPGDPAQGRRDARWQIRPMPGREGWLRGCRLLRAFLHRAIAQSVVARCVARCPFPVAQSRNGP